MPSFCHTWKPSKQKGQKNEKVKILVGHERCYSITFKSRKALGVVLLRLNHTFEGGSCHHYLCLEHGIIRSLMKTQEMISNSNDEKN